MSDALWAPWRMEYIVGPRQDGCVFCEAASSTADRDHLVLARRPEAFVIMNRYPYSHAHIMVVPSRHVSQLDLLSIQERAAFFELVGDAQAALKEAFHPTGMNLGMNLGKAAGAGIADHLHMHLLPRWEGDTNFMPMVAGLRVMHEHLEATYDKMLPFYDSLNLKTR